MQNKHANVKLSRFLLATEMHILRSRIFLFFICLVGFVVVVWFFWFFVCLGVFVCLVGWLGFFNSSLKNAGSLGGNGF